MSKQYILVDMRGHPRDVFGIMTEAELKSAVDVELDLDMGDCDFEIYEIKRVGRVSAEPVLVWDKDRIG